MKTVTAVVMLVLTVCATPTRAQLVDDSLGAGRNLADAGYRYDDTASLLRALSDGNETVAIFATTFLAQQRATPEIVLALRTASESPREPLALSAFSALQRLGAIGWEGSAIGLMQGTREDTIRLQLAGILAQAGRSDGWFIIRDALTPDDRSMALAFWSAGPFHGLKAADGTTIDAISELRRLQRELRERGRSDDASHIEIHIAETDRTSRRRSLRK
jgi:hypothetical protein